MELFVLRHGQAGKRSASGSKDSARPLTITGQKEVADIAASLKDIGIKFDLIITSPLKRSHQTAAIVAKKLQNEKVMEDWDELKPEGKSLDLYRKLSSSPQLKKQQSSVLVVGHEPYLSNMIGEIISDVNGDHGGSTRIVLKKAGIARIRITSNSNSKMQGELKWLLTPRHMKNMLK
ncbi:MAG TPA: phosphohistidine phosphatase SixA [Nitrososphaeraceae archaeon]|nr:phosphohistidine phosphatase SixA [Nitrososphaeraceae archaeon]